jgi:hypothetical protein
MALIPLLKIIIYVFVAFAVAGTLLVQDYG